MSALPKNRCQNPAMIEEPSRRRAVVQLGIEATSPFVAAPA